MDLEDAFAIFNSAPTPYLVLAPDFTIIAANKARLSATQTTLERTIGLNLFTAFPDNPDDVNADGVNNLRSSLEIVLKTKAPHRMAIQKYDIPIHSEHGIFFEEKYWSPLNFPILDSQGNVKYIIHQVEDVTEEVLSKKQIASIEAINKAIDAERLRLFSVFEQAPIGICLVKGPELVTEFANTTYRKIAGGLHLSSDTMNTYLSGEKKIIEELKVNTDWDHTNQPYEKIFYVILQPLFGQDGRPEGVITVAYDNTEKVKARLDTRRVLEDLRQEKKLRERFVTTLTHDLRSPLTAAKMFAQLLGKSSPDSDGAKKYIDKILNSIERCDQMIINLLDANRISAGEKIPVDVHKCSMKKIVQETVEELSTIHGDRFLLTTPVDSVEGLWSDNSIKRILENLCTNAIKYGSKTTKITVILNELADTVILSVHNWGNVMSPEDQENLFHIHRRADTEANKNEKGWGLGLTLVKGITEALDGAVFVSSSLEKGTIFKVTLPKLSPI